jgi:hypothetical protein
MATNIPPAASSMHYLQVTCPKCGKNMLFQVERGQEKVRLNCCNCKIAIDVHCGQRAPPPQNNAADSLQKPAAEQNTPANSAGAAGPSPNAGTGSANIPPQLTGNGSLPNSLGNTGHLSNPSLQVSTPELERFIFPFHPLRH